MAYGGGKPTYWCIAEFLRVTFWDLGLWVDSSEHRLQVGARYAAHDSYCIPGNLRRLASFYRML